MTRAITPALRLTPIALLALTLQQSAAADTGKQVEKLDRGVVAVATGSGVFVGWRVLGTDAADTRFNMYRDGVLLNAAPLEASNFVDPTGTAAAQYVVRTVVKGSEKDKDNAGTVWPQAVLRIPVEAPAGASRPMAWPIATS
ncbi:hypothetical protein [Pseudoduganella chitinolytica]|uniref:Rhamnogalacturonan I lyase beta-sheet domain-containing protein n=1 Tax=Pseudoduganella chitinolytica TaxID=34070 RepID=A0ABY8B6U5_9BURK|nr:hypothetical protein [Pseudoduganella chitinolytica]WEF30718.1 hypothetical protein PX653_14665 [Pseudoduganella chitinolytica]